ASAGRSVVADTLARDAGVRKAATVSVRASGKSLSARCAPVVTSSCRSGSEGRACISSIAMLPAGSCSRSVQTAALARVTRSRAAGASICGAGDADGWGDGAGKFFVYALSGQMQASKRTKLAARVCRARVRFVCMGLRRFIICALAVAPRGLALLHEGAHAFARVLGLHQLVKIK